MAKKILVTGGLGFIGSHTTVELIKSGYEVVIIDDLSNSQLLILDNIEKITGTRPLFYELDMVDYEKLINFFNLEKNIDAVIHFAASKAVGESMIVPLKYFRNNLYSLINLLDCMKTSGIKNIVFSSSATVYGDPDDLPVTEDTAFKPALSSYGSTKQMGEDILRKVAATGSIDCIALRYFNPVGAHDSALLGESPVGTPNNLMPFVTQTAAGTRKELVVFGDDYNTADGTCIRDYIHVVDLAKAHVKSCNRLLSQGVKNNYEVFNIGTGIGISVLQIIQAFEKYNDIKLNYKIGDRRAGDAPAIYADVSLANKILDWKAELGLKEMVISSWEWQKKITNNV
ncbi:MAG: UDP-glucose 4-epimerase GalE [Ginsengibacter sp.]